MTAPAGTSHAPATPAWLAMAVMLMAIGCASPAPEPAPADIRPPPYRAVPPQTDFESRQKERAIALARQGKLADAAVAWEILEVLRPDVPEYREQLSRTRGLIDAAVAERLQRASQAQRRGDLEAAAQGFLAVLALQPEHTQAADALRAIERERNKRNVLGRAARLAFSTRGPAASRPAGGDAAMAGPAAASDRNELEHAAMLTMQGDYDDAIQLLERRLASMRQDDVARSLLADAYYQKAEELAPRDKAEAINALEKSVRLDPAHPLAGARLKQLKAGFGAGPAEPAAAPRAADKPASRPGKRLEDGSPRPQ